MQQQVHCSQSKAPTKTEKALSPTHHESRPISHCLILHAYCSFPCKTATSMVPLDCQSNVVRGLVFLACSFELAVARPGMGIIQLSCQLTSKTSRTVQLQEVFGGLWCGRASGASTALSARIMGVGLCQVAVAMYTVQVGTLLRVRWITTLCLGPWQPACVAQHS